MTAPESKSPQVATATEPAANPLNQLFTVVNEINAGTLVPPMRTSGSQAEGLQVAENRARRKQQKPQTQ